MSVLPDPGNLNVLAVANLRVRFPGATGPVTVVDGVDLSIGRGERFGLVGESGSGKTVTMLGILGLIDPPGEVTADTIGFAGQRVDPGVPASFRAVRGRIVTLVMQDPLTSLSPLFSIGDQLVETLRHRFAAGRREARREAAALLTAVGIPDPVARLDSYPHQLSGGMRQRVAIALALACRPSLLIADEPTTALDATIRAQVMELLLRLAAEREMAIALITHDFGLLAGFATRVAVMYAGRLVEYGPVEDLFARPAHPYTRALLAAQPRIAGARRERLPAIPGQPPD
ncbi:MAG: ABC transporter ATP-binding protein, partial [Thermomicrobiales bacterium]